MGFARCIGATGCSSGPSAGALALNAAIVEAYSSTGVYPLGIYNCRKIAGTDTWSLHAEGRAVDLGVVGASLGAAEDVVDVLLGCGDQVLQRIIHDHTIWDLESPAGRPYSGSNPHVDHIHVELSWSAARGEIPLELRILDEGDLDMTPEQVREAVRDALNAGTGAGQESWAGTSKATLGIVQGLVNAVGRIEATLARIEGRAP